MSAASSPPVQDSRPLNPNALSYEPLQSIQPASKPHCALNQIYLPYQFPLQATDCYHQAPLQFPQPRALVSGPSNQFMYVDTGHRLSYAYYFTPPSWNNMGDCLTHYNSLSQPDDHQMTVFESEKTEGKKKKNVRCWDVPPRLKPVREYPFHSPVSVWVPRKADYQKIERCEAEELVVKLDGKTSLMIRNVPNHLGRSDLLKMLDRHCWSVNNEAKRESNFPKSAYDFFYLPMDFGFGLNLGFAFVNFTSSEAALKFFKAFDKQKWSYGKGKAKTCEIVLAKLQGRDAFLQQFQWSTFGCHTNQYLPVVFCPPRDGFNRSKPTTVGRRTRASVPSKVMIMSQRKERKAA